MKLFLHGLFLCATLLSGQLQASASIDTLKEKSRTLGDWRKEVAGILFEGSVRTNALLSAAWPNAQLPALEWREAFADAFVLHWAESTPKSTGCFGNYFSSRSTFSNKQKLNALMQHDLINLLQKQLQLGDINQQTQALRILGSYCRPESEDTNRYLEFINHLMDIVSAPIDAKDRDELLLHQNAIHALGLQIACGTRSFEAIWGKIQKFEESKDKLDIEVLSELIALIFDRLKQDHIQAKTVLNALAAIPNNERWFNESTLDQPLTEIIISLLDKPLTTDRNHEDEIVKSLLVLSEFKKIRFTSLRKNLIIDRRYQERIPLVSPEVRLQMLQSFENQSNKDFTLNAREIYAFLRLKDEIPEQYRTLNFLFGRPLAKVNPQEIIMLAMKEESTEPSKAFLFYLYGLKLSHFKKRAAFFNALALHPDLSKKLADSAQMQDFFEALLKLVLQVEQPSLLIVIFNPFLEKLSATNASLKKMDFLGQTKQTSIGLFLQQAIKSNQALAEQYNKLPDGDEEEQFIIEPNTSGKPTILGEGSFGKVILARDRGESLCALKLVPKDEEIDTEESDINSDGYDKLNEGKILELIPAHANIIKLLGYGVDKKNSYYFAMELCESSVNDLGTLSEQTSKPILVQIVAALSHLRNHHIAHRDLKTSNVLLKGKVVKLADFGLAVLCEKEREETLEVIGETTHVAPEIINGPVHDTRCDLWSLALVACDMVMDEYPLSDCNTSTSYPEKIWSCEEFPKNLSPEFVAFVLGLLKREPTERYGAENVEDLLKQPFLLKDTRSNVRGRIHTLGQEE